MKEMIKRLFSPFKGLTSTERWVSTTLLTSLIILLWWSSGSVYIPNPADVIGAIPTLLSQGLVSQFLHSISFCLMSMGYSILISVVLCYMSVIPVFTTFCELLRKFRFLPSTGLSFFFMKVTPSMNSMMSWMMVFGITTWLVDSMVGIALSISPDEVMYARSLRLTRWQSMRELLVYGKAADLFNSVISNFAMAWMLLAAVESIVKSEGGIGVMIADGSKYYHYDQVYCILILILLTGTLIDYLLRLFRDFLFPYYNIKG